MEPLFLMPLVPESIQPRFRRRLQYARYLDSSNAGICTCMRRSAVPSVTPTSVQELCKVELFTGRYTEGARSSTSWRDSDQEDLRVRPPS